MEYRNFLHELFDTKPPDAYINIWTNAGKKKKSNWFQDIDKAADFIDTIVDKDIDIYIQPGFCNKDLGAKKRGAKKDIAGLPGFYMDIDLETNTKPNCPPTMTQAISLVEGNGWNPTMIIFTGHGIHVWWLFKECWEFEPGEFKIAEDLNKRLQATIKERATKKKWILDSTQDVTRLLRPPGTYNLKVPGKKIRTMTAKNSGPRFSDPLEFDDWILSKSEIKKNTPVDDKEIIKIKDGLVLNKSADPPTDKLDDLLDIDVKFKATWAGARNDLPDNSPSSYAMSLANVAAEADWTDQEIANLIVAWYRRHRGSQFGGKEPDLKSLHPKKIALTIGKARLAADEKAVKDYSENIAPLQGTQYEKITDPNGMQAKKTVCKILGFDILRLMQFEQERSSHYRMYIKPTPGCPKGVIPFYSSKELTDYSKFKDRILEKARVNLRLSKKNWQICTDNWSKFLQVVAAGEITAEERMASWLEIYLQDKKENHIDESLIDLEPFVHNGIWHIFASKFYNWSWQNVSQTEGLQKTDLDFSIIGAKKVRFTRPHPDDPSKRKVISPYEIPVHIVRPKSNIQQTNDTEQTNTTKN